MPIKDLILEYSNRCGSFSHLQLWEWLTSHTVASKNTLMCELSRMVKRGELLRTGRGMYRKAGGKTVFNPIPEEKEKQIFALLKDEFPFAHFCVYNGSVLETIQHHLSDNKMIYLETDRTAVEPVFRFLQRTGEKVWLEPDAKIMYLYVNLSEGGIIVKPLITESPIEWSHKIPRPTLEKLLVDIRRDADFSYLQGSECERMWENAKTLYNINQNRLIRYASRRGISLNNEI